MTTQSVADASWTAPFTEEELDKYTEELFSRQDKQHGRTHRTMFAMWAFLVHKGLVNNAEWDAWYKANYDAREAAYDKAERDHIRKKLGAMSETERHELRFASSLAPLTGRSTTL